jgi:hypothetical protein
MVLAIAALAFQLSPIPAITESVVPPPRAAESSVASSTATAVNRPASSAPAAAAAEALFASNTDQIASGLDGAEAHAAIAPAINSGSFALAVRKSESLSTLRVVAPDSKAFRFVSAESLPSRRKWLALAVAQHAAATFDAYFTRQAIAHGAVESDPLMRPFAQSPAIYAAIQAAPVVLDFAARRMQRSQSTFLRRTWWVPQSVATGMFVFSGAHNLHVANAMH